MKAGRKHKTKEPRRCISAVSLLLLRTPYRAVRVTLIIDYDFIGGMCKRFKKFDIAVDRTFLGGREMMSHVFLPYPNRTLLRQNGHKARSRE
jgi:hypothetical protein